jgi:carboxyl-terminal processing protease
MRPRWRTMRALPAAILLAFALALGPMAAGAREALSRDGRAEVYAAVVAGIRARFHSQTELDRLAWEKLAGERRPRVLDAASDTAFAAEINALLGELKISHTGFLTPDDVDYYVLLDVFRNTPQIKTLVEQTFGENTRPWFAGIGVFTRQVEGRHHVDLVLEGSPADRAGVRVGDEIVSVGSEAYTPVEAFRGKAGETVRIGVRRAAGGEVAQIPIEATRIVPGQAFREAMLASARVIEAGAQRIGYVHVWAVRGDEIVTAFNEAVDKLAGGEGRRQGGARRTPLTHLIVDLRGKIGGDTTAVRGFMSRLAPQGPQVTPKGASAMAQRPPRTFKGHTIALIDRHTRSAAEILAHGIKSQGIGPLIGTRTATAVTAGAAFPMPGRNLLYVAVQALEIDGVDLEGQGVVPDVVVERPLPYAQGADPVLDAALDHIMKGVGGGE